MYQKTSRKRWHFNEPVPINFYEDDEEKNYLFNLIPTPWVTRVILLIEVHSRVPS